MNRDDGREDLESRIKDQFPAVFITLVSVLIGLVLADLVAEARARMVLFPLSLGTLRTWAELAGNGFSALVAWVIYSHIGISRRRIPSIADAFIAFSIPLTLLFGTPFVGVTPTWPWFYFATLFLAISLATTIWLLHVLRSEESELETFNRLARPTGYMSIFALGIPFYAAVGWADQHRLLSPLVEVACIATAAPSALFSCHLFMRDWHQAIRAARATGPE